MVSDNCPGRQATTILPGPRGRGVRDGDLQGHRERLHAHRGAVRGPGRQPLRRALVPRGGAVAGLLAVIVGIRYLVRHRRLRVERAGWRMRFALAEPKVTPARVREFEGDTRA